jgi:hypothetical protein
MSAAALSMAMPIVLSTTTPTSTKASIFSTATVSQLLAQSSSSTYLDRPAWTRNSRLDSSKRPMPMVPQLNTSKKS